MNKTKISNNIRKLVLKEIEIREYIEGNYLTFEEKSDLDILLKNIENTVINLTYLLYLEQNEFEKRNNIVFEQVDYSNNLIFTLS